MRFFVKSFAASLVIITVVALTAVNSLRAGTTGDTSSPTVASLGDYSLTGRKDSGERLARYRRAAI